MSDKKANYSAASKKYVSHTSQSNSVDAERHRRSKERERKYNANWSKNEVNINDAVSKFAPNSQGVSKGVKYVFESQRYVVKADMSAGYLRIYDKQLKKYVKLNGQPGNNSDTHFKIKKRSEM